MALFYPIMIKHCGKQRIYLNIPLQPNRNIKKATNGQIRTNIKKSGK